MTAFTESVVEQAALAWLESAGWQVAHGLAVALQELEKAAGGASIGASVPMRSVAAQRAG